MEYDFNRKAFRSLRTAYGVDPLAVLYGSCVLIELGLKQNLGLLSTSSNTGHNIPALLHRVSVSYTMHRSVCNVLKTKFETELNAIFCHGRGGNPQMVPSSSYPYLRYIRHSTDWLNDSSTDADIQNLNALVDRIINFLTHTVGVAI